MKVVARIKDGKIDIVSINIIKKHLQSRKDGEYQFEVKKVYEKKATPTQRLLWNVYAQVASITGYETEEIHAMMGQKFLLNTKAKTPYVVSTSTLNKTEFQCFVNSVLHFFIVEKKLNINLPKDYAVKANLIPNR